MNKVIHIRWILSAPVDQQEVLAISSSLLYALMRIDTHPVEQNLDNQFRQFWEVESLGIMKDEPSMYDKFIQQISFNGQKYQVSLP